MTGIILIDRMRVVKLTEENFQKIISAAERVLRGGGLVVGLSDTVYGIYCDAANPEAVKKIFRLKKRVPEKALPIFVKDVPAARRLAYIDERKVRFLEKVWPGPVTAVFYHKEKLPKVLTGSLNTIGIRIPDHVFLLELLRRIDFPIAQTSANFSGRSTIRTVQEIGAEQLPDKKFIDLVIDGGELPKEPSVVIDFTGNEPIILRMGVMTKTELDEMLGGG